MKKNILLFLLLFIPFVDFSQSLKPFNLADFEGKKITSTFKSTTEIRGGWPGIYVAPTNQYHTVHRSIAIRKKEDNWFIEKLLSKINIIVENTVTKETGEYDSDKKFDRPMEVSMVYGMYDKFINKPYQMIYDKGGKRIDTLGNFKDYNFYYDYAWDNKMLPYIQENWVGIFQISHPTVVWAVGQTWQQTLTKRSEGKPQKELLTSTYKVKSIENNTVLIEFKVVDIPEFVSYKAEDGYINNSLKDNKGINVDKDINYTIEQKSVYEGTILCDSQTNLILKMIITNNEYKKIYIKDSPPSGREYSEQVTIENTLEDLK
ncbi:MAG: hypothetical protein QE277_01350 [Flectobacillus sp.]|nr:hypothetical protein [Flectobacillus sp.]